MSEEKKIESSNPSGPEISEIANPNQPKGYGITWDSHRREVMILQIPLKEIANESDYFQALVYLKGFFSQCKDEAIALVIQHKQQIQKNGVLKPTGILKVN